MEAQWTIRVEGLGDCISVRLAWCGGVSVLGFELGGGLGEGFDLGGSLVVEDAELAWGRGAVGVRFLNFALCLAHNSFFSVAEALRQ